MAVVYHASHARGTIPRVYKTVVINAVGLTSELLKWMPLTRQLGKPASIGPILPAVTCSVQATYLTGTLPSEHGIVGNGWYFRDQHEIKFWHQSDALVQRPRIWDIARHRDPSFTCANLFWWHAMYSSADITVTPRPMYLADGRKVPDIWTNGPTDLRKTLQDKLGPFPLFRFWGPAANIESTRWIAKSAMEVDRAHNSTLTLIYLPHLDYPLQKLGPKHPAIQHEAAALDAIIGELANYFQQRGAHVIVLSEYGIEPVNQPIHINRILRGANLLSIREELGLELLDAGASKAFAVADHQVAHIYINDHNRLKEVADLLRSTPGIEQVLNREEQKAIGIAHERTGELVAVAKTGTWFTYYYWQDDAKAPDFARTVDIHRKPGYDPVELFTDASKFGIGWKLLQRKAGLRTLLKVIPLDASLVQGSHGRVNGSPSSQPVFLSSHMTGNLPANLQCAEVFSLILEHLG